MATLKALYLQSPSARRVSLQGPALCVHVEDRAPRPFPLRRLSHVVSDVRVAWDTEALAACLSHNVPVSLLDADGQLAGLCLGARPVPFGLRTNLLLFCDRPDWREWFELWRRAVERRMILRMVRHLALPPRDLRPDRIRLDSDRRLAEPLGPAAARQALDALRSLIPGTLTAALTGHGLPPTNLPGWRGDLHLLHELAGLFEWEQRVVALRLLREAAHLGLDRVPRRQLLIAFENHAQRYQRLLHVILDSLEKRVLEVRHARRDPGDWSWAA